MSILNAVKEELISRGLYSCIAEQNIPCPLSNPDTNCKDCIHEKGATLLAIIGINILGASIHKDLNFDLMVEIENQIALSNAGIEPVVTEKYAAYPDIDDEYDYDNRFY
ncbi:MAG: hypothetical protein M0R17_05245 [Candidatus Omnitrophica bacterium]|jgi:hypothetical protein|nr:hypothetical protein [Candidatus Omnitrophota bacterium]